MPEIKSRKVRKVFAPEAQAQRLLSRYQQHRDRIDPIRTRALRLLQEACAIEITLTGSQLGVLRNARLGQSQSPGLSVQLKTK